jgi:hypothetical protein
MNTFPDEVISRNYKIKESLVTTFINKEFKEYNIFFDKRIQGGGSQRRPDILININTYLIICEIDENGHKDKAYNDEDSRTVELIEDSGDKQIVIIRFNPDKYIDENGKKIKSCFKIDKDSGVCIIDDEDNWKNRLETLKNTVIKYIKNIPENKVTIEHLFYTKNTS